MIHLRIHLIRLYLQRAVPDLSAYDDDINIVQDGHDTALSGTSAACPIVAGMLGSVNDALAAAGAVGAVI